MSYTINRCHIESTTHIILKQENHDRNIWRLNEYFIDP